MIRTFSKQLCNMALQNSSSPFSRAVVSAMRQLYPERLAERSWDNTGLLLEAPYSPQRRQKNSVLLTVDLTKAVADEAIERRDSLIIAYHPIIFRGLKSLTLADSQQQSLLRLAAEGISVYSPHTAVDAASAGLGDWLADIVTAEPSTSYLQKDDLRSKHDGKRSADSSPYSLTYLSANANTEIANLMLNSIQHERTAIKPFSSYSSSPPIAGHEAAGMGRLVRFHKPQTLLSIIHNISLALGYGQSPSSANPNSSSTSTSAFGFPLAIPQSKTLDSITDVTTVGICAGSGSSLFASSPGLSDVDLLFTGEMSHHEVLAATERGQCVIAPFHSNTERGFLSDRMRGNLEAMVKGEWERLRESEMWADGDADGKGGTVGHKEVFEDESVRVDVSERDRDPYGIVFARTGV